MKSWYALLMMVWMAFFDVAETAAVQVLSGNYVQAAIRTLIAGLLLGFGVVLAVHCVRRPS